MRLLAAVIGLAVASALASAQGGNSLLVNGDFEQVGPGGAPGWSFSLYPSGGEAANCIGPSNFRAKSGQWSLRIDTQPLLGQETTIVFNGAVAKEAARLQGTRLVLSGWIYVEPGAAVRTIGMRLRMFGDDGQQKNAFLGDVLSVQILGTPGEWVQFRASGVVPKAQITNMDLHCSTRPDMVRALAYLDDLRLEPLVPPMLEVRLLRDAVWQDEFVLPIEGRLSAEMKGTQAVLSRLIDPDGKEVGLRVWALTDVGVHFFPLRTELGEVLSDGRYRLRSELDERGRVIASSEGFFEVSTSPWEGAPARPKLAPSAAGGAVPEAFTVPGSVAPTDAQDALPQAAELGDPYAIQGVSRQFGYVVFARHYLDSVSRLGRPLPGECGSASDFDDTLPGECRPLRIFACPAEYEPTAISVWALRSQSAVAVKVSDLVGEQGTLSAANIAVRVVRRIRGLPPFLEKRPTIDIPEGQTQTFWLTVHVPPDAKPGFYWGTVEVGPTGTRATQVPLLLRVLPLRLPPPPRGYGFWWKLDGRWKGYNAEEHDSVIAEIRRQFVLLREYGCNMVSCYGMPKMTKLADGSVSFDFEQDHWGHDKYSLAEFVRLGRETGFLSPNVPIQYPGADSLHSSWIARAMGLDLNSAAFDAFYSDACQRVNEWAKQQGFTLAFACIDEIGNSAERRTDALRFYALAQQAGTLTSVTDNSMHGGVHLMGQPRFDEKIKMRLYNFITPEMIEHARASGDIMWLYNLASSGWDAKRDRFVFGLFTERCGAAGCAQWAFQWPSGATSPYEAAAAGERSGYHYALPAPDGPLPTLALEAVREGIDDARYLALLRERSPEAVQRFLDDIQPLSTTIGDYLAGHSGTFFDVRRWQIAREAMKAQ